MTTNNTVMFHILRYDSSGIADVDLMFNLVPQKLNYSYSPNFSEQSILGRPSPLFLYTGGSDQTYSFSITIHEDMMTPSQLTKYSSLEGLIDVIKSLSYPSLKDRNDPSSGFESSLRDVYFQLGSITGLGIINTSVTWKKPLRAGKYVLADISFTVTITEPFEEPAISTISTPGNSSVDYTDLITVDYSLSLFSSILPDYAFGYNVEDIHGQLFDHTLEVFNLAATKLSDLYYAFNEADAKGELSTALRAFKDFKIDRSQTITKSFIDITTYSALLNRLTDKFIEEQLMHYYKNINTDMLESERIIIEDALKGLVQTLKDAEEALILYAPST